MPIGNNIRKIRESKGISVDQISKKIGIFKSTYIDIERGVVILKPNSGVLKKIANFLNITVDGIVNYREETFIQVERDLNSKNLKDISVNLLSTTLVLEESKPVQVITPITKTPINVVLEDLSIKEVIYKKPKLLTSGELFQIGSRIKTVEVKDNLPTDIYINREAQLDPNLIVSDDRSFSAKLLNYTEPFIINGVEKTLFYTNINTGLKVGDRVFIINGNFDSNNFIKENRYKAKNDGYKVLFIDRCKVVLDIDYAVSKLPFKPQFIDDFINVYLIERRGDFIQANRQITARGGNFGYKFREGRNNIIFVNSNLEAISSTWGGSLGINQPGFYVKGVSSSWLDITTQIVSGSFSTALGNFQNNGKLRVNNGSFTFSIGPDVVNFNEGFVYDWKKTESGYPSWVVDNEYNEPFITKSNFRRGDFDGTFNSGVYGTQDLRITWDSEKFKNSSWKSGVLLNAEWLSGNMESKNALVESFLAEFDDNNIPYQKLNAPNNNGRGFNIIENSTLNKVVAENGTFNNSIIQDLVGTYSIMEEHIGTQSEIEYGFRINGGLINRCRIKSGFIRNSDVVNSRVLNTKFENIKSINSNYKLSVISNSIYLSDNVIKITDYDEFTIAEKNTISHKIYRFYISEDHFKSLKIRDRFYIRDLIIKDGSKYPLNFFDRRFRLSSWTEYFDNYDNDNELFIKKGVEVGAFLSTPGDNDWLLNYNLAPAVTITTEKNKNPQHSIDIIVSTSDINNIPFVPDGVTNELPIGGLSLNRITEPGSNPGKRDLIDISLAYIVNSDFESGIIENTDWIDGNHINYNNDVNIIENNNIGGTYSIIAITSSSELLIKTGFNPTQSAIYKEAGDDCLEPGNIVFLSGVEWQSPSGGSIKIGDTYEIVEGFNSNSQIRLRELVTNTIQSITESGGTFSTPLAQNRYNYLFKAKISKSKISGGIFRRAYLSECFIENESLNIDDRDFNNIPSIKGLVISDSIFKDTNNILSKALYMNSSFIGNGDTFRNGIVFNSIWNGMTFLNGLFKESRWVGGQFNGGLFYNNRSFDGVPLPDSQLVTNERLLSYYKDGGSNTNNNRYSWQNGQLNGGEFFESDFENGQLNGGKFYYSKFYTGQINGGVIGDLRIPLNNTIIYSADINFTIVNNATVIASNNFTGNPTSSIIWNNGEFNNGEFGSKDNNFAVWKNGEFNNGNFENSAKWENGQFNGGRFLSTVGWTMSESITQSDYTWQNGQFNGGQFGNGGLTANSTWFTGEFNGGKFIGRVWNNGILTNGEFIGSSTYSATRGVTATQSNALLFTDSFTSSYFGLWRDGVVSDKKDDFIKDRKIITNIKRAVNDRVVPLNASIVNSLWLDGTFNHTSGLIQNSIWLDGRFERGTFFRSSFNPYVRRSLGATPSFELSDSCYWQNGDLLDSDFYLSKWEGGKFDTGDAYGMIWKGGICNYMNAFNIFWEGGLWRNGNWYGSYMDYNGTIEDDFYKQILNRGFSWSGTQSAHIWNIFEDDATGDRDFSSGNASNLIEQATPEASEVGGGGGGFAPPL